MALFQRLNSAISELRRAGTSVGMFNAVRNKSALVYANRILRRRHPSLKGMCYRIYSKDCNYPLQCRYDTSDISVFTQVFNEQEYAVLNDLQDVRLIIDCGANVGYSAAYFLNRYPEAQLIAVEPDSANFAILQQNMKPYGDRVKLYMAGIWSHSTGLTVCRGSYRDGAEWSTQVRESLPGETPDVEAVDIGTLLRGSGHEFIDILKIDIEGSETVILSENYAPWLKQTRNMAIELHDEECERIFYKAIEGYPFSLSQAEDIVLCKTTSEGS